MLGLGKTELLVIYLLITKKGWMTTRSIVNLLGMIRKSESAVRATLFRLQQKDIIKSRPRGRETLLCLSQAGNKRVAGYMEMLSRSEQKWNGKWLLFSFNIPDRKRALRNALREELLEMGFGRLHTNLWISPHNVQRECERLVTRLRVKEYTEMFTANYIGANPREFANRVWDLTGLIKIWDRFMKQCRQEYDEFRKIKFTNSYQEAVEALTRLIALKSRMVDLAAQETHLPYDLFPVSPKQYKTMGDTIFKYIGFFRDRASSIIKFDPIEHEKHHSTRCKK